MPESASSDAAASARAETRAALAAMAEEAAEMGAAVGGGSVTDAVAGWLAPQYAQAAREHLEGLEGEERLEQLRAFVRDWAVLRKGDQTAERLRIERERVELEKELAEERQVPRIEAWLRKPGNRERLLGPNLNGKEKARRLREIFGAPESGNGGLSPKTLAMIEKAMRLI